MSGAMKCSGVVLMVGLLAGSGLACSTPPPQACARAGTPFCQDRVQFSCVADVQGATAVTALCACGGQCDPSGATCGALASGTCSTAGLEACPADRDEGYRCRGGALEICLTVDGGRWLDSARCPWGCAPDGRNCLLAPDAGGL